MFRLAPDYYEAASPPDEPEYLPGRMQYIGARPENGRDTTGEHFIIILWRRSEERRGGKDGSSGWGGGA